MNRRYLTFVFVVVLMATGLTLVWYGILKRTPGDAMSPGSDDAADTAAPSGMPQDTAANREAVKTQPAAFDGGTELRDALIDTETALRDGMSLRNAAEAIAQLRARLLAADPREASATIRAYLASGRDANTGLRFTVGPGGSLDYAPTLRSALIDLLAQIDPQAALEVAETVFNDKTSADEYAISLRNVAVLGADDPGTMDYVAQRTRELLTHEPWVRNPTSGFAEAFDAVAYTRDMRALPILSNLIAPDAGQAVNHPAFVTIDRLMIDDPDAVLETLEDNPALLEERSMVKAGIYARADPADAAQTALARDYLLSQAPDSREARYFLNLYPNLNTTLAEGLLTRPDFYGHDEIVARLHGALDVINQWRTDPAMAAYADRLDAAAERIRQVTTDN